MLYFIYLILFYLLLVIIVTSEQYYCFVLLYHCEFEIYIYKFFLFTNKWRHLLVETPGVSCVPCVPSNHDNVRVTPTHDNDSHLEQCSAVENKQKLSFYSRVSQDYNQKIRHHRMAETWKSTDHGVLLDDHHHSFILLNYSNCFKIKNSLNVL